MALNDPPSLSCLFSLARFHHQKIFLKKPDSQLVDITPVGGTVSSATSKPPSSSGSTKQQYKSSKSTTPRPPVLANVIAPTKTKSTHFLFSSTSPFAKFAVVKLNQRVNYYTVKIICKQALVMYHTHSQ